MKHTGICTVCNETFSRNRPLRGSTCSPECRGALRKKLEERICKACGTKFQCIPSYPSHHCSITCFNKSRRGIHNPKMFRVCEFCGKQYKRAYGASKRRFCSMQCGHYARDGFPMAIVCAQCGKETKKYKQRGTLFCSKECLTLFERSVPRSKGIFTNLREAKKELLKKHAGCQHCNYSKYLEILELHHVDRNRRNNHVSNLILLCPTCHTLEHWKTKTGQFANNVGRKKRPPPRVPRHMPTPRVPRYSA